MEILTELNSFLMRNKRKNDAENVIKTIDPEKFKIIFDEFKDSSPYPGYSKYLDTKKWFNEKLKEVYKLKLDSSSGLDILDIGTGAGYFPYVCNYFGHNCMAIDLDSNPMYNDLIKLLKINRIEHEIKAYQNLPDLGKKFDLVTAYAICFNNHELPDLWSVNEWNFFIKDLANNHTKENSKVLLVLNPEKNNQYYDNELLKFFIGHGAKVNRERVFFNSIKSFRK